MSENLIENPHPGHKIDVEVQKDGTVYVRVDGVLIATREPVKGTIAWSPGLSDKERDFIRERTFDKVPFVAPASPRNRNQRRRLAHFAKLSQARAKAPVKTKKA